MRTTFDAAVELLSVLLDVAAAITLAAIGLGAELTSLSSPGADLTMALRAGHAGLIALAACWLVLTDRIVPRFGSA